jgi:hypothetical protein
MTLFILKLLIYLPALIPSLLSVFLARGIINLALKNSLLTLANILGINKISFTIRARRGHTP